MPTPTPTPALITVNPQEDPEAFLQAIPASERSCLVQAFGAERLLEVVAEEEPSSDDAAKLAGCASEETARRLVLGQMMLDADISEQSITCISAELRDVSFLDFLIPQEEQSMQMQTSGFQLTRAMLDCLSEEAAEIFGGAEAEGGPSVEQLKCLYAGEADPETLAKLFTMLPGVVLGAPPPPELLDIFTRCGVPFPSPGEEGGPPELTEEQQSCIIEAIGETAFSEIVTGQRPPTQEELQKIEACGP